MMACGLRLCARHFTFRVKSCQWPRLEAAWSLIVVVRQAVESERVRAKVIESARERGKDDAWG